ncbi:MAG: TatD family hydrolase [Peptostreptococcaceae bacterium]|nr:TatD family hydrolase [Peptostreptococcaceae bacterium]
MLFDTHAHMDHLRFEEDREALIARIQREGVSLLINPGADMPSSRAALALARKYDFIYAAAGVHPHEVKDMKEEDFDELREMAKDEKVIAIGEIGLDYYYDHSPRERQREYFIRQLQLAEELDLPVIIHSRDAAEETYEILAKYMPSRKAVLHCFSQSPEMAERYLKLGCFLSFAGPLTFRNAAKLKEAVRLTPMDRLFIETDSPYLAPEPFRGKRNDPSKVRQVALEMARLKGTDLASIAAQTKENACRFFRIGGEN